MPEESVRPRIYLEKVHLKGFRSIDDLSVNLHKGFNVIIGKNGSGKSNFMDCLFEADSRFGFTKAPFDYARLDFRTTDDHSLAFEYEHFLRSHLSDNDPDDRVGVNDRFYLDNELIFDSSTEDEYFPTFIFNDKQIRYTIDKRLLYRRLNYPLFLTSYLKYNIPNDLGFVTNAGLLKINSKNPFVEFPETVTFIENIMWEIGELLDFSEDDEEAKVRNVRINDALKVLKEPNTVKGNLKKYTPIDDIRFNTNISLYTEGKKITIENIKLEFKINQSWMPWSYLSDGTKRLFYLVSEITSSNGLILLEEPELGIHPHQFALLMDFLKEQAETKQIIISTHSPKALDYFSENELDRILVCNYDLKKGTQIRHLSSKEVNKAKKYMKEVGFFSDYWLLSDLE